MSKEEGIRNKEEGIRNKEEGIRNKEEGIRRKDLILSTANCTLSPQTIVHYPTDKSYIKPEGEIVHKSYIRK